MNRKNLKELLLSSLSLFFALGMAIILYFILLRFQELRRFLYAIFRILAPFIYGGVIAYVLKTPCNHLEAWLKNHPFKNIRKKERLANLIAVFLVFILALVLLYLLLATIVPEVFNSCVTLTGMVPNATKDVTNWVNRILPEDNVIRTYLNQLIAEESAKLQTWAQSDLLPFLQDLMGQFASQLSLILGTVSNLLLGIIVAIYVLLERRTLARQGKALVYTVLNESHAKWLLNEMVFIDRTFTGFLAGKILDSAVIGLICYTFCFIMSCVNDFPYALLISLIVGVTNIIPYFGPFIGAVPSALLVLMYSPTNCIIFVIFIIILQQVDGNIIGPKLLSSSVGIGGLWVLFSITFFGGIFGFAGILIGVPVFAIFYNQIRRLVVRILTKKDCMWALNDPVLNPLEVKDQSDTKPAE